MPIKLSLLTVATLLSVSAFSAPRYKEGQLIIRLKKDTPTKFMSLFSSKKKTLSKELNLHVVKVKSNLASVSILKKLRSNKNVLYAQLDHYVSKREATLNSEPNDDLFSKQWSLSNNSSFNSDINAPEAWDLVFKNPVPVGQEPVLAIVDGGVDIIHEDLEANMWINKNETSNGVDDDGNGYIDDIHGWNAGERTGKISAERHGTHVGGIAGGRGNNKLGITGVNPRIKIMTVVYGGNSGSLTSRVLAAYSYIYEMKKLWLETKGKKGANVVATNSSFGVDRADCNSNEFAAWNDMYNRLGDVGILSAAATANNEWDIDVTGDVPTGCDSDFLISVTNSNDRAQKFNGAGYGAKTIDLAAPGTDILATLPGNNYGELTGTSMATPHVTGAVGLLHMINHKNTIRASRQKPREYALYLKNVLLETVSKKKDLSGITVSGGILNLETAVKKVITDIVK